MVKCTKSRFVKYMIVAASGIPLLLFTRTRQILSYSSHCSVQLAVGHKLAKILPIRLLFYSTVGCTAQGKVMHHPMSDHVCGVPYVILDSSSSDDGAPSHVLPCMPSGKLCTAHILPFIEIWNMDRSFFYC